MKQIKIICTLMLLLMTTACTPLEKQAYNTIVGAKAFLDTEKKIHTECSSVNIKVCTLLSQATAAKDLLIDATEEYCAGDQFMTGGACQPPTKGTSVSNQVIAKLKAAIAAYDQAAKDLQGAL